MKKLLVIITFAALVFLVVGLFLPREVHVERSIAVSRPAHTVFTLLNSYRHFNEWSPWANLDPDAKFTWSGPDSGPGARLNWIGDPALIGSGWQEITASIPNERIEIDLNFGPQGMAQAYFDIAGDQLGSRLTWGFDTDVTEGTGFFGGILGRYFGLFFDRWIGSDYEQGLASFKQFAESLPANDFSDLEVEVMDVQPLQVLLISGESMNDTGQIAGALASAYGEIMAFMNANGIALAGQPMAITTDWSADTYAFQAAIPVGEVTVDTTGRVQLGQSPSGRAVRVVHVGPYERTDETYASLDAWLTAHGHTKGQLSWEHFISDPGETPEEAIITHIYQQLADD